MPQVRQIQLGKQGVTDNFIESLRGQFNNCKNVKVSVLASARESKDDVKKYSEEILDKLGKNFTARVIGFTIVIKKWRRDVRK
ncbi:YhbY family RNA-binding protein [Candidatus Pacearchaeota archaeon]|nr:YhbY family RNA-binding protein [Candidatus Pacearchaeota archaeon]